MANNREKALKIIAQRREDAENQAEQRRRELEAVSPELRDVDERISRAGFQAFRAAANGQGGKAALERLHQETIELEKHQRAILEELGAPTDILEVHYTCPICRDTGVHDHRHCKCYNELVRQLNYKDLNAVAPAKKCTFASFSLEGYKGLWDNEYNKDVYDHMRQIRQFSMDWAADFGHGSPSLLLYGKTGLGKTHLSLAMANAVIEKGKTVYYNSAYNILSDIEREHFKRTLFDESPEDLALNADLLILDDLGSEFETRFTQSVVCNIINTREFRGLPTIISTNLMYDEIAKHYGQRVYSRILGSYEPLLFLGPDHRQVPAGRDSDF